MGQLQFFVGPSSLHRHQALSRCQAQGILSKTIMVLALSTDVWECWWVNWGIRKVDIAAASNLGRVLGGGGDGGSGGWGRLFPGSDIYIEVHRMKNQCFMLREKHVLRWWSKRRDNACEDKKGDQREMRLKGEKEPSVLPCCTVPGVTIHIAFFCINTVLSGIFTGHWHWTLSRWVVGGLAV